MPACGLLGTVTRDFVETGDGRTFESVGGILYQAAALDGLGISTSLFSRCGESVRPEVEALLGEWPALDRGGLSFVPGAGNRVRLRYPREAGEREEILESVVPPLDPDPVLRAIDGLDFLLLAFNSGFEISPADWRAVLSRASCPVWIDIHSLALSPVLGVRRAYRSLPDWPSWAEGTSYLQANRREAACLAGRPDREADETEIRDLCRRAFRLGVRAVFVTLGRDGVLAAIPGDFRRVPASPASVLDPTGCGDVFAAAAIDALLCGRTAFDAAAAGVVLAGRAAGISGVRETRLLASRAREERLEHLRPPRAAPGGKGE